MRITEKTILAMLLGVTASAHAAESVAPIIVTATRTAQSADEALTSVSVISREEIEQSPSRDVAELLATKAGIDLSRTGGPGAGTNLYLRGTSPDHTLVLIDGIRASSATTGQFSWEVLRPEQIERIEIVRGPRASLYGSDAIGGVIHIFTRVQKGGYVTASGGSYGTRELSAGMTAGENWKLGIGFGSSHSDGLPTLVDGKEDNAYDNTNATVSLNGSLSDNTDLQLRATQSQGTSEHDEATGDSDFVNRVASVRLDHRRGQWEQSLLLGQTLDEYTSHSPTTPSTITTLRNSASWLHSIDNSLGITTVGIDYWQDNAEKDDSGIIDESINQHGLFAEHQWSNGDYDAQVALRNDEHETFGNTTTGSIALGHQFDDHSHAYISYGKAFKAPTVNDLYWPYRADSFFGTTYITQGNPELEPEHSSTVEFGVTQTYPGARTNINIYRTRAENLIDWLATATAPNEYTYQPENIGRVEITGIELGLNWQIRKLEASAEITLLDAKNLDSDQQLDRRPESKALFSLNRHTQPSDWRIEWQLVGERLDRDGTVILPGYGLVNASYRRRFGDGFEMGIRLKNLLDKEYLLASSYSGNYATEGQSGYLDLSYRF